MVHAALLLYRFCVFTSLDDVYSFFVEVAIIELFDDILVIVVGVIFGEGYQHIELRIITFINKIEIEHERSLAIAMWFLLKKLGGTGL